MLPVGHAQVWSDSQMKDDRQEGRYAHVRHKATGQKQCLKPRAVTSWSWLLGLPGKAER